MISIAKKVNQYTKAGSIIFVYTVTGSDKELKEYEASQGEYFRTNDAGDPLYFSQRICTTGSELSKTASGRFTVLSDLEQVVAARDEATNNNYGKLVAIQQFAGLTKAQMTERLLAQF